MGKNRTPRAWSHARFSPAAQATYASAQRRGQRSSSRSKPAEPIQSCSANSCESRMPSRRCSGEFTRKRPPSDQNACPPSDCSGSWSTTITRRPASATSTAATSPASPAPITMTSALIAAFPPRSAGTVALAHPIRVHHAQLVGEGAGRDIHAPRGLVVRARQDPRLTAAERRAMLHQCAHQAPADALTMVSRRDRDLVDPELGRLVGMYIVHAGRHPDDEIPIERDDEVMPWIREELGAPARMDLVVEHVGG